MDSATIARRFPWTKYERDNQSPFMTREQQTAWVKENCPFTVRWNVPDSTHGLYGWRCESRSFKSEEAALAAARESMGIARDVRVLRWNWDVPHNHKERAVEIYSRKNAGKKRVA